MGRVRAAYRGYNVGRMELFRKIAEKYLSPGIIVMPVRYM